MECRCEEEAMVDSSWPLRASLTEVARWRGGARVESERVGVASGASIPEVASDFLPGEGEVSRAAFTRVRPPLNTSCGMCTNAKASVTVTLGNDLRGG